MLKLTQNDHCLFLGNITAIGATAFQPTIELTRSYEIWLLCPESYTIEILLQETSPENDRSTLYFSSDDKANNLVKLEATIIDGRSPIWKNACLQALELVRKYYSNKNQIKEKNHV